VSTPAHEPAPAQADLAVVVPSYNHAPYVAQTLRSIFRQTLRPKQLLVIDDGSTDDSPRIIERVLGEAPIACEFVARANRGLAATLNEGFARTSGRYFAYLGSDDLWLPDLLAARVALLDARPRAVLAYGHAYSIDGAARIVDCTTDWAAYRDGDARAMLLTTLAPLSPTVVYRRAALPAKPWNEQARLEDYELYLRLSAAGEFAFDPRILSAWRQHEYNASSNLKFMLEERLAAQSRAAAALALDAHALNRYQALARFRSAQEFMRQGHKLTALRLLLTSLRAAPSAREVARLCAGLIVPHCALSRRRARARQRAQARYGPLPL
jgi:alpha-1,3-rhamnosyltransferase